MRVKIQGLLKARSVAAVDEALEAFDREAYPEFFTADIWEPAGRFLICNTELELEADCDATRAVRAIVASAAEGLVEIHLAGDAEAWKYTQSKRLKTPVGESFPATGLGTSFATLAEEWSEPLGKARAAAAKKTAKAANAAKSSSTVVDLDGVARALIPLTSGHFAAIVKSEVVVFGADGVVVSRHGIRLAGDDEHTFRAMGLTELLDGRLAIAGEYSNTMRVLDREEGAVVELKFGKRVHVESVLVVPGGFVRYQDLSLVLEDEVTQLDAGTADAELPSAAIRWGDRFVITTGEKNLVYDKEGTLLFEAQGGRAVVFADRLYTSWKSKFGRTEADGTFSETDMSASGSLLQVGDALLHASGSAQRFDAEGNKIWFAPKIYGGASSGTPIALSDSVVVMTPAKYPPSARLVVVDFETGEAKGEVVGKGEIEHTHRVNEDTVIGLAYGAQGKKLHVFRNLRSAPKYEAIGGHKKPIDGVAIRGNVVATRSEDGTTRLFDLS
jgi:hypothetical protein